jgi:hypothetical protein
MYIFQVNLHVKLVCEIIFTRSDLLLTKWYVSIIQYIYILHI